MRKLINIIAPILTLGIFAIIVTIMFSVFDVTNRLTPDFWTTTILGTSLTVITTLVWWPVGVDNGKKENNFKNVIRQYNKRAEYIISEQLLSKFSEFCEKENEKFADKLLKNKLSKICLSKNFFEDYKKHKAGIKLEDETIIKQIQNLTKKQIKVLNKLQDSEIKFAPLTPEVILRMKTRNGKIRPMNYERLYKTFIWSGKLIWSVCLFSVLAFVTVKPNTDMWLSKVFQLLIWAVIIIFNIYVSLYNGYKSVTEYRKNYFVTLSTKCAQFFEYAQIPLSKVDGVDLEEEEVEGLSQEKRGDDEKVG